MRRCRRRVACNRTAHWCALAVPRATNSASPTLCRSQTRTNRSSRVTGVNALSMSACDTGKTEPDSAVGAACRPARAATTHGSACKSASVARDDGSFCSMRPTSAAACVSTPRSGAGLSKRHTTRAHLFEPALELQAGDTQARRHRGKERSPAPRSSSTHSSSRITRCNSTALSAQKGKLPVSMAYRVTPSAHTSAA